MGGGVQLVPAPGKEIACVVDERGPQERQPSSCSQPFQGAEHRIPELRGNYHHLVRRQAEAVDVGEVGVPHRLVPVPEYPMILRSPPTEAESEPGRAAASRNEAESPSIRIIEQLLESTRVAGVDDGP